jgi:hypothetical protein
MNLYVLVADSHVVRVLRYEPKGALEELVVACNSDARLHDRDLAADRSGRVINGAAGIHQTYAPAVNAAEYSLRRWLRALARGELRSIVSGSGMAYSWSQPGACSRSCVPSWHTTDFRRPWASCRATLGVGASLSCSAGSCRQCRSPSGSCVGERCAVPGCTAHA